MIGDLAYITEWNDMTVLELYKQRELLSERLETAMIVQQFEAAKQLENGLEKLEKLIENKLEELK